jgi:hypothetical protein
LKSIFSIQLSDYIKKLKILIEKIYENQIKKLNFFNKYYNENYVQRWFFSTNHKDIGTLYILFGSFAGIIGTVFSVVIRLELSEPLLTVLNNNNQLYNVIITGHAFIMIFFL